MSTDTRSATSPHRPGTAPVSSAPAAAHGNGQHTPITGATETPGPGEASFEDGILAQLPALHRLAVRLTRRQQDAEDLVQETVARALAHRAQFQHGTSLRAWLLTIERSIFLNAHRRMRSTPRLQSLDEVNEGTLYGAFGMRSSPSAEHVLLHGGMDDAIAEALRTLPEHYRVAVELCDVQGLRYAEIAQRMGWALGTVMSRLHRGRALLRRALAEPGGASPAPTALPTPGAQPVRAAA